MEEIIKKVAKECGLTKNDYYLHQQSKKWIMKKEAIEKISDKKGIVLEAVQVLNSERDFVRFLITMSMGELRTSSVGEADSVNCKGNKYFGCMAEKRGIGRVVLRLIGLSQHGILTEDDFSNQVDKSFNEPKNSSLHTKPSESKSEESVESPPTSSLAWRKTVFTPCDVPIKDLSREDCFYWFKNIGKIYGEDDKTLITNEYSYRVRMAKRKSK